MTAVKLHGRAIGPGNRCFVIAEAGVNHNGDVAMAEALVDAAAAAGADAVKFQTFDPDRLASPAAPTADYQGRHAGTASQREMLAGLTLTAEAHYRLMRRAQAHAILFLSSPFDSTSADLLESLDVCGFKIPSGELTHHALLAHLAHKGRPLLLSTGMSTLGEVGEAVAVIRAEGDPPLALLHCVSSYPADPADANLRAMDTLRQAFATPVGWSDHTLGIEVALAAVARGADVIEKHLTLDRSLPGPDHRASLDPEQFVALVAGVRRVESALGTGKKEPVAAELPIAAVARKSLHWAESLPSGSRVESRHLLALRPGTGLPPARLAALVGRRLRHRVEAEAPVAEGDLE